MGLISQECFSLPASFAPCCCGSHVVEMCCLVSVAGNTPLAQSPKAGVLDLVFCTSGVMETSMFLHEEHGEDPMSQQRLEIEMPAWRFLPWWFLVLCSVNENIWSRCSSSAGLCWGVLQLKNRCQNWNSVNHCSVLRLCHLSSALW